MKTGVIISGEESLLTFNGKEIDGGAATVMDLPLDPNKVLKSLTLKTLTNDVVVGLMAATLMRKIQISRTIQQQFIDMFKKKAFIEK